MPGKPAPEPKSAQTSACGASGRSCSESAMCRVQRCGSVEAATRFCICCRNSNSATKFSSRCSTSRETGVSASACVRSALSSRSRSIGSGVLKRVYPGALCAGRAAHARPRASAPPASCRRSPRPAPIVRGRSAMQLLFRFVGEAGQRCVVEVVRQFETFVAPKGSDVRRLALEIDRVFGVDLDLLGDLRRHSRETPARCGRDPPRRYSDAPATRTRCAAVRLG